VRSETASAICSSSIDELSQYPEKTDDIDFYLKVLQEVFEREREFKFAMVARYGS
jgi:hypothetical protein